MRGPLRRCTQAEAKAALRKTKGNKSAAARALKVTPSTFRHALTTPDAVKDAVKVARAKDAVKAQQDSHKALIARCRELEDALARARAKTVVAPCKASKRPPETLVRLIVPDSHGSHIDWPAARAMLADAGGLPISEVVLLGDHLDCGGTFNSHQRTYTHEMTESYDEDCLQANSFLDQLQAACPNANAWHYLEGNHEQHVERWCARNFHSYRDARKVLNAIGPEAELRLRERGISYYRRAESHMGLTVRGLIKLGKCFYVHGFLHSKHATYGHLERVGAPIVHGHTHRAQSVVSATAVSPAIGSWCPGTLALLNPLYKHTAPAEWSHGYMLQFVARSGEFMSVQVPILGNRTLLPAMMRKA